MIEPPLVIAYDPSLVTPDQYARLVAALGDLIRLEGGAGLKQLKSRGFGVIRERATSPK
jgi:hypothetical protein